DAPGSRDVGFGHLSGNLMAYPLPGLPIEPFGLLGFGGEHFGRRGGENGWHLTFDAGGGLIFVMSENTGIRLEVRNVLFLPRTQLGDAHINDIVVAGGLSVALGGHSVDEDGDGVPDKLDRCPKTPVGCRVDASGCPLDSDGDGICDGVDQCPGTPRGAVVDRRGCPIDADDDGVPDGIDQCPETPHGAQVDAHGCPLDSDGDVVGELLTRWPELRIEIGGHTDSRGSAAYNQRLSEARASAVLDYLTAHFRTLRPEQFTAHGYGESKPLVPNTSALNMAKNR